MLLASEVAHNVILLALSLKTLERAFQRLVLADFDCGHAYTTFVLYRTLISPVIVTNRKRFVNDFSVLNGDISVFALKSARKTAYSFGKSIF